MYYFNYLFSSWIMLNEICFSHLQNFIHITPNESKIGSSKFIITKYINNNSVDGKKILQ